VTISAHPQPSAKKKAPFVGTNSSGVSSPCLGEVNAVFPLPVVATAVATCTVPGVPLYEGCVINDFSLSGCDRGDSSGGWAGDFAGCCCWLGGNSSIRLVSNEPSLPTDRHVRFFRNFNEKKHKSSQLMIILGGGALTSSIIETQNVII